jgi:hypothetical protein
MDANGSRSRAFAAALLLVAIIAHPGPSYAQDEIDTVRRNARLHVGGIYFTPTLQIKEFGLDSNVFNQTEQTRSEP